MVLLAPVPAMFYMLHQQKLASAEKNRKDIIFPSLVRTEIAASSVGSGFYEACLAFHTTTNKVSWLQHMIIMEMPTLKTIILRTICYEIA